MYKVFVNNKPLILIKAVSHENIGVGDYVMAREDIVDFRSFVKDYEKDVITKRLFIVSNDIENLWEEYQGLYKQIYAAGGVVRHKSKGVLYIYRTGKWDLPKGKMEKDENIAETAVREVEEECGVGSLEIIKQLPTTYHTYEERFADVLKTTHWYEMYTEDNSQLVPQAEEGIEKACWLEEKHLNDVFNNTFASINELLDHFYVK
jgi:8-oxo-dGTP pyrophosphatase MutT (NUDIX family)